MTTMKANQDNGYQQAREMAVRRAAYLHSLAQGNPAMRERCLRYGINPDLPLGPQITPTQGVSHEA